LAANERHDSLVHRIARVGFIVTNMARPAEIKEGKGV
jgi:hypothetical protein